MRRRDFVTLLGCTVIPWAPVLARAQQPAPGKFRIGLLWPEARVKPLLEGLREHGYVENQNVIFDRRYDDNGERLNALAAELVALKPDIISAGGTQAVLAVQQATKTIPLVIVASNPVGNGLVLSLNHPGGNTTGMSLQSPDLSGKRLELVRQISGMPAAIAILLNPYDPPAVSALKETQDAAQRLNLQVTVIEARKPDDIAPAFEKLAQARPGALVILTSVLMSAQEARVAGLALQSRLPSIYPEPSFARAGGLMSYGPDFSAVIKNAASYIDRILKGAQPEDLPVEQPTKFDLVVNLKTAKALGLTIPESFLSLADEVIE
jgi:putative tryptophan/tyrosine transport system substrate-binding protein